jgi:hypothetical protein
MKTNKTTLALAVVAAIVPSALTQTASGVNAEAATGGTDILALLADPVYAPFINIVRLSTRRDARPPKLPRIWPRGTAFPCVSARLTTWMHPSNAGIE